MKALLDSQIGATNALSSLKVGALFMEAGTGKTRAAMELIKSVVDVDLVLWLCPFQTKDNLKVEVAQPLPIVERVQGLPARFDSK